MFEHLFFYSNSTRFQEVAFKIQSNQRQKAFLFTVNQNIGEYVAYHLEMYMDLDTEFVKIDYLYSQNYYNVIDKKHIE